MVAQTNAVRQALRLKGPFKITFFLGRNARSDADQLGNWGIDN